MNFAMFFLKKRGQYLTNSTGDVFFNENASRNKSYDDTFILSAAKSTLPAQTRGAPSPQS